MTSCLDSWAILAWLDGGEPAASIVQASLDRSRPKVSWINLVEVEYCVSRDHGPDEARLVTDLLRPQIDAELPGVSRMRAVAALQAEHAIALADCFAVATATAAGAPLITGDPELIARADRLACDIVDATSADAPLA